MPSWKKPWKRGCAGSARSPGRPPNCSPSAAWNRCPGGYTWRTDARLTLPSPLRLTQAHALNFVRSVECPVSLVLAEQGMLAVEPRMRALLETLPFERHHLPGGHHLHLDDEAGAQAVARVFAAFFAR